MHTRDKIKFFALLANFVNVFSGIHETYKLYFSMFSSDLNHLMRKSFSCNELEQLHYTIIETLCVHEGLFGESECLMVHHQMLHFARFIEQMGPIDSFWTYVGERAMWNVKDGAPKGGQNFIKTILGRFSDWEQQRIKASYCTYDFKENNDNKNNVTDKAILKQLYDNVSVKVNSDGKIEHNDLAFTLYYPIKIHKHINESSLTVSNFEMNNLLKSLVYEICKQFKDIDTSLQASSFYRLYFAYKEFHFKILKHEFLDFLFILCKRKEYILKYVKSNNALLSTTVSYSKELIQKGCIYETDLVTANFVETPFKRYYKEAYIFGKRFTGQGIEYTESSDAKIRQDSNMKYGVQKNYLRFDPHNPLNNLTIETFTNNGFSSSLVRYRLGKECHKTKFNLKGFYYGNINYFFRISCPNDLILNELPMCNLIPRKVYEDKYKNHVMNIKDHYYQKNIFFVPVTNIYASAFLTSPPINVENKMLDVLHENDDLLNSRIYFIPLHPNSLHLKYEFENNMHYNGLGNYLNSKNESINIFDELIDKNTIIVDAEIDI